MEFEILGENTQVETFASGRGIRERRRLTACYGAVLWRKRKGIAWVRLSNGVTLRAEVHWYEASGIGKRELKIKSFLDV